MRTGIRAGLDHGCDILVKFDADLQHDPHDIIAVIEPLLKNDADIVYGNRFNSWNIECRLLGGQVISSSHGLCDG